VLAIDNKIYWWGEHFLGSIYKQELQELILKKEFLGKRIGNSLQSILKKRKNM